jgi:hypothetical protein
MTPEQSLIVIKVAHTVIWAVMATAILAIPVAAAIDRFRVAAWLTALILVECAVLALNHGRCPLTDMAARFTTERGANFDIYLPLWLAEHNKTIFGGLFVAGEFFWLRRWLKNRSAQKNGATRGVTPCSIATANRPTFRRR